MRLTVRPKYRFSPGWALLPAITASFRKDRSLEMHRQSKNGWASSRRLTGRRQRSTGTLRAPAPQTKIPADNSLLTLISNHKAAFQITANGIDTPQQRPSGISSRPHQPCTILRPLPNNACRPDFPYCPDSPESKTVRV
ncbi:hypothetical protein MAPG_10320 [Magnaporthiopsis poae ATCC 64411]|uniref:Uncharacterized protein n=1 Tax=Magnaporthiopsis poae (strain ATCC 64411 / 73-15) TaxID=644358 RepID=A0A0C4ECA5_MAGP6|nr:hypothetical protein MAPG_10320 [Magnaporthiopsis poae ATCC 64411]